MYHVFANHMTKQTELQFQHLLFSHKYTLKINSVNHHSVFYYVPFAEIIRTSVYVFCNNAEKYSTSSKSHIKLITFIRKM